LKDGQPVYRIIFCGTYPVFQANIQFSDNFIGTGVKLSVIFTGAGGIISDIFTGDNKKLTQRHKYTEFLKPCLHLCVS